MTATGIKPSPRPKEAKVVIIGPSGSDVRDAYTIGFQKKYPEIEVDFSGMRGAEVAPKLLAELKAKQYLTDIALAGATTALTSLVPANAVVSLQPYLMGPETRDVSKWQDTKHHFSDKTARYNLYFGSRVQVAFVYNTELNPPATMQTKVKTWQDLLNPEWKGKIAVLDPRQAGAGLDLSTYWYTNEKRGLAKNSCANCLPPRMCSFPRKNSRSSTLSRAGAIRSPSDRAARSPFS